MTRVRGMAAWQPRAKSLALLNQVEAVLAEYRDHLPLTLRQIFYRLVGVYAYDKTEQAYKSLGELLNKGRRAGRIPFEVIRDDGIVFHSATGWQDVDHFLHELQDRVKGFWLDRQKNQPRRLLIVVEAAGMVPQIARVASTYGVGVMSTGGFDSTTAKYDLAQRLNRMTKAHDCEVEVLHIGDYDPSGVHIFSSLAEDVLAFVVGGNACIQIGDTIHSIADVSFTRLAVTPEQIAELALPTAPPKETDRRRFDGAETVQAEALPPDELARIVREAIEDRVDKDRRAALLEEEKHAKAALLARFENMR